MAKELKDCHFKFRVTETFKKMVLEYCETHDLSISDFLREACEQYLGIKKK